MTGHTDATLTRDSINHFLENGLADGLPRIAELLMNAAMIIERSAHLQADPHQRTELRNGHANGFKPRSLATSLGKLGLQIPQVRDSTSPFKMLGICFFTLGENTLRGPDLEGEKGVAGEKGRLE